MITIEFARFMEALLNGLWPTPEALDEAEVEATERRVLIC